MEENVQYELLLPSEFENRIAAFPLMYIPIGSLEYHSEHLALGNDAIKMHAICCEAARLGGGIVFPPIYYGIPFMVEYGSRYQFKANLPVTEAFLTTVLNTTLAGIEKIGFKIAILATGHTPDEESALVRTIAQAYPGKMKVYGTDDMEWGAEANYNGGDHAAKWETSILWHIRPELVDIYKLPRDTSVPLEGIYGEDPRLVASRELGKKAVIAISRDLAELGKRLYESL
jgi:creatinine amidohydrolase